MLLGLILATPACVSKTTSTPDYGDTNARKAEPEGCWQIMDGSGIVGYLVRFKEGQGDGNILLSVRNRHNQDLGWIDGLGRAWRYRPHEDPEWISTGSTLQGVRHILELGGSALLKDCSLSDLPTGL
jgi:hypothetical protein